MDLFLELIAKYPVVGMVFFYMGMLRIVFKPIFSIILQVTEYTPSPKDDAMVKGFMDGKIYKAVAYVLDYAASIKLPKK